MIVAAKVNIQNNAKSVNTYFALFAGYLLFGVFFAKYLKLKEIG